MKMTNFSAKYGSGIQLSILHVWMALPGILSQATAVEIHYRMSPPLRYSMPLLYLPRTHGMNLSRDVTALETM